MNKKKTEKHCKFCGSALLVHIINTELEMYEGKSPAYVCEDCGKVTVFKGAKANES